MKNLTRMLLLPAAALTLSGCVYTNIRLPLSKGFRDTRVVTKSGEASIHSVAWLVAWGDAGLQQASANGGMETLEYADRSFLNILFGLYFRNTTVVYGH